MASSARTKIAREILDRYRLIRALHVCYYNRLESDVSQFSSEFFYLVGDVIEGRPIDESRLRFIDMNRVKEFLKEDR